MAQTVETIQGWKGVMVHLGLESPSKRAFVAFVVTAALVYCTGTPKCAFTEDGEIKRFTPFKPQDGEERSKHFLVAPTCAGALCGLFI